MTTSQVSRHPTDTVLLRRIVFFDTGGQCDVEVAAQGSQVEASSRVTLRKLLEEPMAWTRKLESQPCAGGTKRAELPVVKRSI